MYATGREHIQEGGSSMNKMKLLAATDFSEDARQAAMRAAAMAAELEAQLDLLHVMSSSTLDSLRELFNLTREADTKLLDDARRMLGELVEDVAVKTGLAAVPRVEVGHVVNTIISAADQADMLVLGARGLSPLRDVFLGTTAENLLRKCKRPVLVSKRTMHESYRRVIVPVDLTPHSAFALRMAATIAPRAHISVINVFDVPFEGKLWLAGVAENEIQLYRKQASEKAHEQIGTLIRGLGVTSQTFHPIVEHGDAARVILELEDASSPDLIVIGKHSRSAIGEMLLGSVTRHVLSYSRCDVLVVNE
jgi:nucleotide-binding universal stress UspA family protein